MTAAEILLLASLSAVYALAMLTGYLLGRAHGARYPLPEGDDHRPTRERTLP